MAALPPAGQVNTGSGAIASGGSAAAGAGGAAATGENAIAVVNDFKGYKGKVVIVDPGDRAGALAEIVSQVREPVRQPKRVPPRRFRTLVGRADDAAALDTALAQGAATVLAGLQGAGKSTLLVDVLNGATAAANADGVILLERAPGSPPETADDLAQRIYDAIWDTGAPRRLVDANTAQAGLAGIAPIIAIDGAELTGPEQEVVARLLPRSPIVFVASTAPPGSALRTVPVGPMPRADAVRLLAERAGLAGRTGADVDAAADAATLDRAAELLDDWPGALATIADMIAAKRFDLTRAIELLAAANVGDAVAPARAYRRVVGVLRATLVPGERAMLEAVAGLPGVSVAEAVATKVAAKVADPAEVEGLLAAGLVWRNSPRLRMDDGLRAALVADAGRDLRGPALTALAESGGITTADEPLDPQDATLGIALQQHAAGSGDHAAAIQLGRALDPVLMSSGAWDAWKSVLDRAGQSATASANQHEQGWVEHELGVRALGLRRTREARAHLRQASIIRRRIGDAAGVERTASTLAILRLVPTLLGTAGLAGIAMSQVVALGAIAALTALALPLVFFAGAPAPTPPPTNLPPSHAPATQPGATTVVAPFEVTAEFAADPVMPNGDWTGTVTVRPTGGIGPYVFTFADGKRVDGGAERFPITGARCESVDVSIAVDTADGASQALNGRYVPEACATFNPPDPPGSGDPSPGIVLYANCSSQDFGFGVSLDSNTAKAVSWSMELQRLEAKDAQPYRAAFDSTSSVGLSLGCDADYLWHAASKSADGWQSAWSDWWSISLRPTATPKPNDISLTSCAFTTTLSWSVEQTDGIASYHGTFHDLTSGAFQTFDTKLTQVEFDVSCLHEYEWSVASRDYQGRPSPVSDPARFTVPGIEG